MLNKAIASIWMATRQMIADGKVIDPMAFFLNDHDSRILSLNDVAKDIAPSYIQAVALDTQAEAVIIVHEAWISLAKQGERLPDTPPSETPGALDAAVVAYRTKEGGMVTQWAQITVKEGGGRVMGPVQDMHETAMNRFLELVFRTDTLN